MSDPWEDFGPWDEFPKEQATGEAPPLEVPDDIGAAFMRAPDTGFVRNTGMEAASPGQSVPLADVIESSAALGGVGLQKGFHGLGESIWSLGQALYEPIVEAGPVSLTLSGIRPTSATKARAAEAREIALEARKKSQELAP